MRVANEHADEIEDFRLKYGYRTTVDVFNSAFALLIWYHQQKEHGREIGVLYLAEDGEEHFQGVDLNYE